MHVSLKWRKDATAFEPLKITNAPEFLIISQFQDNMSLISDSKEWDALISHASEMKKIHLRTLMEDSSR